MPGDRRYALLLEYDGTDFAGSQRQRDARTVQGEVEEAARQFCGRAVRVAFAGRTDSGVHAAGQVAAVTLAGGHRPGIVRDALNHFLPRDVAVRAAGLAGERFDPRRDARGRVYVTDRDNQRIQVFDADGAFLAQWPGVGPVSALFMNGHQQLWTGNVLRDLDGAVVARLPVETGGHGATVSESESGGVFLAQLSGRVQKFIPK